MAPYALISVYDKSGAAELARTLTGAGYAIISTGGTERELRAAGIETVSVAEFTGAPEILDGRVKTLHPKIYAGLLYRRDSKAHRAQLDAQQYADISVVVCNLYPFAETIAAAGVTLESALEQMDIGGVTLIRAAAKSFKAVTVLTDPRDYARIGALLAADELTEQHRRTLAARATRLTSEYDCQIAAYLDSGGDSPLSAAESADERRVMLRYGENPHQSANLTADGSGFGVGNAEQLSGGEMSYTNYIDADAAFNAVCAFNEPAAVIVKHATPCGIAVRESQADAFDAAFNGDPVSAYGGVVAFNTPVTLAALTQMRGKFFEIVIAPGYEPDALANLGEAKRLRALKAAPPPPVNADAAPAESVRSITGGILRQTAQSSAAESGAGDLKLTQAGVKAPTADQQRDLVFAWQCVKYVKSNAIVIAKSAATIGIGAGQPNRVGSVKIALAAAGEAAKGAALASDAFFPFADSIELAADAGIGAIIAPSGSIRDSEVAAAAGKRGVALVFTDTRVFLH